MRLRTAQLRPHRHERRTLQELPRADHRGGPRLGSRRWARGHALSPEPNGYPHIGHAKSIWLNFDLAERYGGTTNLRFDDTNPAAEEQEYVDAIQEDIRWLGYAWDELRFASDYFEQLFDWACELIGKGLAYVDDQTVDEIRKNRGSATSPGVESPYRDRSPEENLDLFRRMRAGEFEDGSRVLRAKIDMAAANMNLRDPVMYRILRVTHHRTRDEWCIYPLYDWAHGQSDAIEGITHSVCTLEFENRRALYDWYLDHISAPSRPRQHEFARLNLEYTVVGKRKLRQLVERGEVAGWDDPRMPTLRGMRRRGYTPESIRTFCERIGVTNVDSVIEMVQLENALRDDLNRRALRRFAVLRPLAVVITNWPEGHVREIEAVNNPEDESAGTRTLRLDGKLWIERDDFRLDPPPKYFRLAPGREVRLRYGCVIRCDGVVTGDDGEPVELRCTFDDSTWGGAKPADGRKVKGIVHWVGSDAPTAEVRLYDHLFRVPNPADVPDGEDWLQNLNPSSLEVVAGARIEPALAAAEPGPSFQFERLGYFCADAVDSQPGAPVFNRAVTLRNTWAKIEKRAGSGR